MSPLVRSIRVILRPGGVEGVLDRAYCAELYVIHCLPALA